MNTGTLTQPFRDLGLMHAMDRWKFHLQKWKNRRRNKRFLREHPGLNLPPEYMLFEAFQLDYLKYYEGGKRSAKWVLTQFEPYADLQGKSILDWGCGPARIVRHLPEWLGGDSEICATDYNPATIAWCREHIAGVAFSQNNLDPPLPYPDGKFDLIYGISIFTHLSEQRHHSWFDELMRVCKKGGLVLLTTHGEVFREKLAPGERSDFDAGKLVTRGKVVEGHRVFAAFHPPMYLRRLFETQARILQHTPGERKSWGLEQDVWLLRKL